jgi:hypothetical protein
MLPCFGHNNGKIACQFFNVNVQDVLVDKIR